LQEHAGAYYVTEPIETEEGTMMGLALQPHDVQFEEEDYEEYCMLSDYFTYKKIAQCVSVKGSQNEESIFSVISKLEQPMGQLELAVPGQPLVGYLYQDTVQEQHIFYDCLLQGEYEAVPTIMIDGNKLQESSVGVCAIAIQFIASLSAAFLSGKLHKGKYALMSAIGSVLIWSVFFVSGVLISASFSGVLCGTFTVALGAVASCILCLFTEKKNMGFPRHSR